MACHDSKKLEVNIAVKSHFTLLKNLHLTHTYSTTHNNTLKCRVPKKIISLRKREKYGSFVNKSVYISYFS